MTKLNFFIYQVTTEVERRESTYGLNTFRVICINNIIKIDIASDGGTAKVKMIDGEKIFLNQEQVTKLMIYLTQYTTMNAYINDALTNFDLDKKE